jgi:hypothetical protein
VAETAAVQISSWSSCGNMLNKWKEVSFLPRFFDSCVTYDDSAALILGFIVVEGKVA